jgi:hypothetical protein
MRTTLLAGASIALLMLNAPPSRADDHKLLPDHFSPFDDAPLPAYSSSGRSDPIRDPADAAVGRGMSGIPDLAKAQAEARKSHLDERTKRPTTIGVLLCRWGG